MRRELLQEYHREREARERQARDEAFRQAHSKLLMRGKGAVPERIKTPSVFKEPKLLGKQSLDDIRGMLREWIKEFPSEPQPEDVDVVGRFVVGLVEAKNLEKAQLVVTYLEYLCQRQSEQWMSHARNIRQQLCDAVESIYHCPLRFT